MIYQQQCWVTNITRKLVLSQAFWPNPCILTLENSQYTAVIVHNQFRQHLTIFMIMALYTPTHSPRLYTQALQWGYNVMHWALHSRHFKNGTFELSFTRTRKWTSLSLATRKWTSLSLAKLAHIFQFSVLEWRDSSLTGEECLHCSLSLYMLVFTEQ